jgi:hypothetical protein
MNRMGMSHDVRHPRKFVMLICEGGCNPHLELYDVSVRNAMRARHRVMDSGFMSMTEFGAPSWRSVRAKYTEHFRVGTKWECAECGRIRKWGDD